jgi:haloalkane dehalogenase
VEPTPAPELPARLQALLPAGVRRELVDVGEGLAMHVMRRGTAGPTVLMVHGNPTWSFLWRKVMAALREDEARVVAPDLVGLGLSSRIPARRHTLEHHGRWMGALIDALELRDVVLVVQDWGGPIGLLPFVDRPDRLAGLVVANTVIGPPKPGFRPTAFHRFAAARGLSDVAFRLLGFPQNRLHTAQGDPASIRGDVAWAYRWPLPLGRRAAPLALARMVPDGPAHPSVPALRRVGELVAAFRGPAAIVWGDRDPILGRVRSHVERTLPQATVRRTEAGHFLQEEVPDALADAIREVTAKVGGAA